MERVYVKYDSRLKDRARRNRMNPTPAEQLIWEEILKEKRFYGYKFIRQKMLGFFIVDFYCSKLKLVIEIDGDIHNDRIDYDRERTVKLNELGLQVVRFTNEEVLGNIDGVYNRLKEYLNL